jgi:hypothetical protein
MGALSDTLKPRYQGCRFGELIDAHADAEDRAVIDDGDVTNSDILAFVNEHWGAVSRTVVGDHRRKVCSCYRDAA